MYQYELKIEYSMVMVEEIDNQVHEQLYDMKFQDDQQQHIDIDQYVLIVHEKPLEEEKKIS
jgi:hypothetical protein